MRKYLFSAAFSAFLLAACSSTPDPAPAASATTTAATPQTPSASQRPVAPVTTQQAVPLGPGPAGAARVVYFDFDSYQIRPEFQALLESHARFLRANPTKRIVIEGHTDERGGREYNVALGHQRSEAVARALSLLGAGRTQLESISFGEEKPAAAGSEETAWSRNRRAEIAYR
jgi:peptidoglycan-associated lipoprotein